MRNVAPSRSLSRRSRQVLILAIVIAALAIFLIALGVLIRAIPLVAVQSPAHDVYIFIGNAALVIGGVLVVVAIALAVRAFTWKVDNDLAQRTGQFLEQHLDDRFTFIRNISKLAIGYVDAVLVGPPGVLVFRIIDAKGNYANEGMNWMTFDKEGSLLPARISPSKEARQDSDKIKEYLTKHGLPEDLPIYEVVVFTGSPQEVNLRANNPGVPITHLEQLMVNLQPNYLAQEQRINAQKTAAVVRNLYRET